MSVGEVRARLTSKLRTIQDRREYSQRGREAAPHSEWPYADAEVFLQSVVAQVLGSGSHEFGRTASHFHCDFEAVRERGVTAAEGVLSGSWMMLGHQFDLTGQVDWHRDPRSEFRFDRVFYNDVALGQESAAGHDVKYVWELGRQQYLVELARGWRFTCKERFAQRACHLILDWIEMNPVYEGVHWTSALEVAMRSISWIWTLATSAEWKGWNERVLQMIASSLSDHADYLSKHFSFYSSPYNHLIGEATGLYLLSQLLTGHPRASLWCDQALAVLNEHGPLQFYSDGFSVEQATGYHFYTLGFLTMVVIAARKSGQPLMKLESHVHQAFVAGVAFRQPNGRWPAIGDVDSARSIPVHHEDFWQFDSLCHVAAVLFDDSRLKIGREPGEELFWLLGIEGLQRWSTLSAAATTPYIHLSDSGYAIATDGNDWLMLDAGPIAAGLHADSTPSTAHGHLDVLQVLYCIDRQPVLTDSGMPFYFGDSEWVRHFRSPAAHNTLEIEGISPATNAGGLAWSYVLNSPSLTTDLTEDAWLMSARAEWGAEVTVERHILCLPGEGMWIADWIKTSRPRRVTWYWQFPIAAGLPDDFNWQCASDTGPVHVYSDAVEEGSPVSRVASEYGELQNAKRIRCQATLDSSGIMLTGISREWHVRVQRGGLEATLGPATQLENPRSYSMAGIDWIMSCNHTSPTAAVAL